MTVSDLLSAPPTLVDARGAPHEGAFSGTIPRTSLEHATVPGLGVLDRLDAARKVLRGLRLKRWRYVGIFRDDLVLASAVVDVGYLGVAFAYAAEGEHVVARGWNAPAAIGIHVGPHDGACSAVAPRRLITSAATRAGGLTVAFDLPHLRADLDIEGDATALTVVSDVGKGSGLHGVTVKTAGMRARGSVVIEGRSYTLDDAHAVIDWTEAFFPRHTRWFWAAAAGTAPDGRAVGLNLARGVHDDARGRFSENALWLDGSPSALPPVTFKAGPTPRDPWTIHSTDGSVDLVFEPRGERSEDVSFLVIASRYRQPFGTYTGRLRDARGREVHVEKLPGVAEDHAATW
jgi:hypothetical protein